MNRLTKHLPSIIAKNQSAFVHGRSIFDNILFAQELVRGYNTSTLSPRCALKVDPPKVFDSINWEFIMTVLAAFGFPTLFVDWIGTSATNRGSQSL